MRYIMSEVLMLICLTLMGVYFFKSTDLPKDLKDRVKKRGVEKIQFTQNHTTHKTPIKSFKVPTSAQISTIEINDKSERDLEKLNQEIDEIVLKITSLEEELKINAEKRDEIIREINANLMKLTSLKKKTMTLV